MAGAAVIAAVTNALEGREFPFVFGGDGAGFAVAPGDLVAARDALAATAAWVREDLDLKMRVALVPVSAFAPGASTCASRASVRRRTCPMRCSPAAGSAGRMPR